MKRIIIILALILGYIGVNAQEVYTSSGHIGFHKKIKKKGYDPDKLILGGNLNAAFGTGAMELGIAPIVGYRFFEQFSAGIGVGYQFYRAPTSVDPNNNLLYAYENMVYPNLWARYFIFSNFYTTAVFEFDFIDLNSPNTVYDNNGFHTVYNNYNITNPCLLVGIGFKQPMGGRVSGVMELLYDVLQEPNSPYLGQPVMRIGICVGL